MEENEFIIKNTGLPNYPLLLDRLNLSMAFSRRYHMSMAVCYLRVQPPKKILPFSSTEIIQKLINRLKNSIRDIDSVAKVCENDFIIILTDVNEVTCHQMIKRLISSVTEPYSINFNHFYLTVNIGVCIFPSGAEIQEDLLNIAKIQLFEAIEQGKNSYSLYKGKLNPDLYRRVIIERDLPHSIKNKQLFLKFQPQLFIKEFEIKGVEALIRWKHPILGEVSPNEFIPFAESTGFITSIFFWSLEEIYKNMEFFANHTKISINITIAELLMESFEEEIVSLTREYGIDPKSIVLEITENNKIDDIEMISQVIMNLKKHGFGIALDDFGNGYFSFLDFIKLPVDIIKLDKQFVFSPLFENPGLNKSIKNIVDMAHNLSYQVVVEGIENIEQLRKWKELHCDIIQGYYISKPVPFTEIKEAIEQIPLKIKECGID